VLCLTDYFYSDNFLSHVVTGDKTWVLHVTPESKQQSMEWRHTSSPTKTTFKQTTSTRKIMCTVFWKRKGALLVDFLPQGSTSNAGVYCDTLTKLQLSSATHLQNCIVQSRISDVACLAGVLWLFITTPAHTLLPQHKISSWYLAGNNSIIPLQSRLSTKWFSFVPAS
jgi:hypothetical protein